jgi:hypothetical protein
MVAGRNADDSEDSSTIAKVRASSSAGQRAVEVWESEGGAQSGAHGGRDLGRTALADNAGWRASNNAGWRANHPHKGTPKDGAARAVTLADDDEEDQILRFLGAAVILRWSTIPRKLQRELFDNASSMGELVQADALKGRIARFLHKHKHDAG